MDENPYEPPAEAPEKVAFRPSEAVSGCLLRLVLSGCLLKLAIFCLLLAAGFVLMYYVSLVED